jgi:predicted metal-dependent phosphoesterase TrpH
VIDLHLHSTASDGRCTPAELVRRAHAAGLTTISLTDHDTTAGIAEAAAAAGTLGVRLVPGIEITAVADSRDVHVLGYFFDRDSASLAEFLAAQRADRVRRVRAMAVRLASIGAPIDIDPILEQARRRTGKAVGRPHVAQALMRAGHVATVRDAFDLYLSEGRPGFEPRAGASPSEVVDVIARAGGIASLAHPGSLGRDDLIEPLARHGLAAIEVFHSEHDPPTRDRYLAAARTHGLAISGGSDYHGDVESRPICLGSVALPPEEFDRLEESWRRRS